MLAFWGEVWGDFGGAREGDVFADRKGFDLSEGLKVFAAPADLEGLPTSFPAARELGESRVRGGGVLASIGRPRSPLAAFLAASESP